MAGSLKILFCVNSGAGPRQRVDHEQMIRSHFMQSTHKAVILPLGDDRRRKIQEAIDKHGPDRVVAVGGDGTVNLVATILGGTGLPMGIIPAGSANGLATDLGIPGDIAEAIGLIVSQEPRPIDALLINNEDLCVHLSDLGLNAQLIKSFDATPARGMFTYARLSLKVLLNKRRIRLSIRTNEGEFLRTAFMAVLANARKYGTGATINKEGAIDDGVFEVIVVRRFGLRELWASINARRRFDPKRIEVFKAMEAEIEMKRPAHFQIDGDHKGRVKFVHAKVLPGHIHLIYPLATMK